jgi:exopolysaccharide biosynthesis predicted pyruvyltransferase EpsI
MLDRVTGEPPAYVCELSDFDADALTAACPDGPIFLHGGGNLGDIWPDHQRFREHVIETFADRTIIQLPQSIKFFEEGAATTFARLAQKHPKFTLYVRDTPSRLFAERVLDCPAHLAPDSAFALGESEALSDLRWSVMALLRTDAETTGIDASMLQRRDIPVVDWLDEGGAVDRTRMKTARIKVRLGAAISGTDAKVRLFDALAQERTRRGLRLLSSAHVLICDRLHAHILALLLDQPHVVLDNSYGKIWNYARDWTADYEHLRRAETLPQAMALATVLGSREPALQAG